MAKLTLTDISSGYQSLSTQNANNDLVEAAVENTLSRDGTGPNTMNAQLDMNSQRLVNLPDAVANQEPVTLAQAASIASVSVSLTQENVAAVLNPETAAETAAGLTPTALEYPEGHLSRYGAVGDGVADNTTLFGTILEAGGFNIVIPTGTYLVDPSSWDAVDHILVGTKTIITCEPNVIVRVPTGGGTADRGFIRFRDVTDCAVYGNWSIWEYQTKQTGATGTPESRHIFGIRGCDNIYIEKTIAKKAGGDGYYIGEGVSKPNCSNITLVDVTADNCRRQGLSIIGGTNIRVIRPRFLNITGTAPQYGIDIEPNDNTFELVDIYFQDVYTENCTGAGIGIALQNFPGATDRTVSITIDGHTDVGSGTGFALRGTAKGAGDYDGLITVNNLKTESNVNAGIRATNWAFDGPAVHFNDPVIIRPNTAASASVSLGAAFYTNDDDTVDGIGFHGNILFQNPTILDPDGNITTYFFTRVTKTGTDNSGTTGRAYLTDTTAAWTVNALAGMKLTNTTNSGFTTITSNTATTITGVLSGSNVWDTGDGYTISSMMKDVDIRGRIKVSGQTTPALMMYHDGAGYISEDHGDVLTNNVTSSPLAFGQSTYTRKVTNAGAAGAITVNLDYMATNSPLVTFEVQAAQTLTIVPDAASFIYPGSNGVGKNMSSNNIGDRLTLRRQSPTTWYVVEEIGTWTREA